MKITSNIITVKVKGKNIPINLEGVELCIQNAERLFFDSQSVSIPTKASLLELGLEEISKAWGLLMSFEKKNFDENPGLIKSYLHLDEKKYNEAIKKNEEEIKKYMSKVKPEYFMSPFDINSFSNHEAKIKYLSSLIKFIKRVALPIIRGSMDKEKLTRELLGKYITNIDSNRADEEVDEILNIDETQLRDIISLKENGFYVDIKGNSLISPSSRPYYPQVLEELLGLLIAIIKNDVIVLSNALNTNISKN